MKYSIARFWREREGHYRLLGRKCRSCGRVNYPPSSVCRYCGSKDLEDVELLEKARVLTWTVIHTAPEGFEEYRPVIIAIVELLESKARILTRLTDVEPEDIREGMIVEPVLRRISEDGDSGIIHYAIVFRPLVSGGGSDGGG